MQLPELSLYIHLPWCQRKCPYCDFNSHEARTIPETEYLAALLRDLQSDLALARGRMVQTVFIGGGTPSLFSADAIARLLDGVATSLTLAPDVEVTLEANPGSAEAQKFAGFRAAGINRLSLGVQSLDDACLQALGRVHDSGQARQAIEYALAAGFDSVNIDLMHGLPGQTPASAETDLRAALAYAPSHLSWYQLTIEPNTVFHKRPPLLPLEDVLADIQQAGEELLAAAGYRQYEVSAYSRPGKQCRHNLNYWTFGDYLGIGAGAHGKLSFAHRIVRQQRHRQPELYMDKALAGAAVAQEHEVSRRELPFEYMLNALRLKDGFTLQDFIEKTGLPPNSVRGQLQKAEQSGWLEADGAWLRPTARGFDFLSDLQSLFLPDA